MKLSLTSEKGVEILSLQETVGATDVKVLRAGMQKILKTGKNKIILEMPNHQDLPSEVIREIAAFDVLARELSGRIVLASVTAALRTKIEAFAKPPIIETFPTRTKAIEFLTAPPKPEIPPPVATGAVPGALPAAPAGFGSEEAALRQKLRDLTVENQRLREQVILATIARRPPADEAEYQQKIKALEAKVEKMMSEKTVPAAPGR